MQFYLAISSYEFMTMVVKLLNQMPTVKQRHGKFLASTAANVVPYSTEIRVSDLQVDRKENANDRKEP